MGAGRSSRAWDWGLFCSRLLPSQPCPKHHQSPPRDSILNHFKEEATEEGDGDSCPPATPAQSKASWELEDVRRTPPSLRPSLGPAEKVKESGMEVQAGVLGEAHPEPSPGLGSSSSPIA